MGRIGKMALGKNTRWRRIFGILLLTFGKKVGKIAGTGKIDKEEKKFEISKFSC